MFSSLRWPLGLAFFGLLSIFVVATEQVVLAEVRQAALLEMEEGLRHDCDLIANLMRRHMDQVALTKSERQMITAEMARLSLNMSGRLCIVNWKGEVLEDSAGLSGQGVGHLPEVEAALHGQASSAEREQTLLVGVPMLAHGKVVGAIYGARSLGRLELMQVELRSRLYTLGAAALLLGLALSLALARILTRPLRQLADFASGLGQQGKWPRAPVQGRDEVSVLAQALNDMATRLEAHEAQLLRFVSDASHELKTPVASLRSNLEALESGAWQDEALRQRFGQAMHHDLDRAQQLVGDLLHLHKLDHQVLRPQLGEHDLRPLLEDLSERYAAQLKCPPSLIWRCDPERLEQVLVNLLDNARRATRLGGEIAILAEGQRLVIQDSGCGLAPEHLEAVFGRFFRVDSARSREDGGSGLGLAIARAWVESMGGRLWAESAGLGQGSRLILEFAAASQAGAPK
jgi:two-component system OmpR family sensor kinase